MVNSGGRERIQVSISPQLLERLDAYCSRIGVSRSAFIQTTLGQTLDQIERLSAGVVEGLAAHMAGDVADNPDMASKVDSWGSRPAGL